MTAITTDVAALRLELGNLASDQLDDDQLTYFLDTYGGVLPAAAAALDALATRFAFDFDFEWKDTSFSRSQVAKALERRAEAIRARVDRGGIGVISTVRGCRRYSRDELREVFCRFGWSCDFDAPMP